MKLIHNVRDHKRKAKFNFRLYRFSVFNYLLWNSCGKWNQSWQRWSLGRGDSDLLKWSYFSIRRGYYYGAWKLEIKYGTSLKTNSSQKPTIDRLQYLLCSSLMCGFRPMQMKVPVSKELSPGGLNFKIRKIFDGINHRYAALDEWRP